MTMSAPLAAFEVALPPNLEALLPATLRETGVRSHGNGLPVTVDAVLSLWDTRSRIASDIAGVALDGCADLLQALRRLPPQKSLLQVAIQSPQRTGALFVDTESRPLKAVGYVLAARKAP